MPNLDIDDYLLEPGRAAKAAAGNKGYNLLKLKQHGFNIPPFMCVSGRLLSDLLKPHAKNINDIVSRIDYSDPGSLERASISLRGMISRLTLDLAFVADLHGAVAASLPQTKRFSVRSSGSLEDSPGASFAGQFDTFLDVPVTQIAGHMTKCWSSLFSANVLAYCHEQHLDVAELTMSVVIQEMVPAELSGVMFSANPQGLLNEMVAVVGRGVGENVVSDKAPTTTYYYNLTDKVSYFDQQAHAPLLPEGLLDVLVSAALRATKFFGAYVDIEFAISAGEVFILQVRRITTIDDTHTVILDNSNIVESYPGLTLPLTQSYITEAYYRVFRGLLVRGSGDAQLIDRYTPVLKSMVASVNGRMYYSIGNWYTLIQFLPFSGRILPIWQEMVGVTHKRHEVDPNYRKTRGLARDIVIYSRAFWLALVLPRKMRALQQEFASIESHFRSRFKPDMSARQLLALQKDVNARVIANWDLTLFNDVYAFAFSGLLKNKLHALQVPNYRVVTNHLLASSGGIESLRPIKALVALAGSALAAGEIPALNALKTEADVAAYLASRDTPFVQEFSGYIELYGDRSLEELKLESQTFRSSPLSLVRQLAGYAADPDKLAAIAASFQPGAVPKSGKLLAKFSVWDRLIISFYRDRARLGISNRETSRLNRSRIYGFARSVYSAIGSRLHEAGRLDTPRDIFYLTTDEIEQAVKQPELDLAARIIKRQTEFAGFEWLPMYSRLVFDRQPFDAVHHHASMMKSVSASGSMIGTPSSPGIVEGEAMVINRPSEITDVSLLKDKILITKITDPGWVFLLAVAAGVAAERGSLLSHTAIISRELGIPAVVGVAGIMASVHTGDRVRLNGDTGEVELL